MAKIEEASKEGSRPYQKRHPRELKGPLWDVINDAAEDVFLEGFDPAVNAMSMRVENGLPQTSRRRAPT